MVLTRNQCLEGKETYTQEGSNTDHGAVSTLYGGTEEEFLGRSVWTHTAGLKEVVRGGVDPRARPLLWARLARAQFGSRARVPQWLLRARLCDALQDDPAAHCPHPREELSAGGAAALSAARRRGGLTDSGGVSARRQHAAGRASGP